MDAVTPAVQQRRGTAVGPIVAAGAAVGGLGMIYAVDPTTSTLLPSCPFHAVTGLWCPGCGATRATHELLHGHIAAALGGNLFLPVFAALLGLAWWSWYRTVTVGAPPAFIARAPGWSVVALGAALLSFGVLRNMPFEPLRALAP
jgi:hypothetical protein